MSLDYQIYVVEGGLGGPTKKRVFGDYDGPEVDNDPANDGCPTVVVVRNKGTKRKAKVLEEAVVTKPKKQRKIKIKEKPSIDSIDEEEVVKDATHKHR